MFQSAHAVTADWKTGVDSCLAQLGQRHSSAGVNLGFLYITEALSDSLDLILHDLRERSGISHWVGSTGLGVCINNQSNCGEFFDDPTMVIMAANVPPRSFILFPASDSSGDPGVDLDRQEIASETSKKDWPAGLPFVVAHADTANPNALPLIEDLAESTGGFIVGGLTSSAKPKHHVSGSVTGGSVSGVVFSPDVPVVTALSQGCQPMSRPHTVSRSTDNLIFELDDRPALDVLLGAFDVDSVSALRNLAGDVHAALPVAGSDTADYVVRNLVGVDEDHSVVAIGAPVQNGDPIIFVRRDSQAAENDLRQSFEKLKSRAGNQIKGGLYISCIARGPNMFGRQNAELELIRDIFGGIPLVGLYANGEISNNRIYSYTGVLTLFV